jgi:outer membrane autotransporter protein
VATPFLGMQFAAYTQNALTETTGGPLALSVRSASASSVVSELGGQLATDLHVGQLTIATQAELGWAHEFASTARTITGSFVSAPATAFTISGASPGRDHAIVGLGVATAIASNASVFLRYDGSINGSDDSHSVTGGVRLVW